METQALPVSGIHFTEEDWSRIDRNWRAWWAHELPRPLVMFSRKVKPATGPELENRFLAGNGAPADEIIERCHQCLARTAWYGDAFPHWWPNFGPGIMAGMLGGTVEPKPETVWFGPGRFAGKELSAYELAVGAGEKWGLRIEDLVAAAVKKWGKDVVIGHTDIGGNLDILSSLRDAQTLLMDLFDEPEEVARLAGEITRHWLAWFRHEESLLGPGHRAASHWSGQYGPGSAYMLQSDFSYMISPKMFETFVMPDLDACTRAIDYPFYHLDGPGELPHLDQILSLPKLRGVQWIPGAAGPMADEWPEVLQKIRAAGKLCEVHVNVEGARRIKRDFNGGKGFVLMVNPGSTATGDLPALAAELTS